MPTAADEEVEVASPVGLQHVVAVQAGIAAVRRRRRRLPRHDEPQSVRTADGVLTTPGATEFTRTPSGASSTASALVAAVTAPLLVTYGP